MGGMASGYYGSGGGKIAVEQCRSIDIRHFQREKLLNGTSFVWGWFNDREERTASITVIPAEISLVLSYSLNGEAIRTNVYFAETVTGFGQRKWFLCPFCGERCAVLYLRRKYFGCRKCQDLSYRSSQLSGDIFYYHQQLEKICRTLKVKYEPLDFFPPWKPKGMHWETYEKYASRYMQLVEKRERLFYVGVRRLTKSSSANL